MLKKKSERPFFALATSSISDIPEMTQNKLSQNQYYYEISDYKYSTSPFKDSLIQKSYRDQSINLHFSTAKPFYQEFSPYENKNQYQYQKTTESNCSDQTKNRKNLGNKLIQFSYSNFVILSNHINKITKKIKQNAFQSIRKCPRSQTRIKGNDKNTRNSQISHTTNETYNENIFYTKKIMKKRIQDKQQCIESANLIKRWLEYHVLIIYRRGFNYIAQHQQKKYYESTSGFNGFGSSARKDHLLSQRFNLTQNYSHNERSNQQIQQSLVYTIQNNNQSIRRQTNSFVFDSNPASKKIPKIQKNKSYLQQISQLANPHSFVYKEKELLKYYIKEVKLKIVSPLALPRISKLKEKNFNFSQQVIILQDIGHQENITSLKQQRPVALDMYTPNKADIDHGRELQSIQQILHEGSNMKSDSQFQSPQAQHSKVSNASSVEQNQYFINMVNQKANKNGSYIHQNSLSGFKANPSSKMNEGQISSQLKSTIINHFQEHRPIMQTRMIINEHAPKETFNNQFINKNQSKIKLAKSQQNLLGQQHEQFLRMSGQKKLDELQNERFRVYKTQRNHPIYHQKPVYYTNKNVPEYSSIIMTQTQRSLPNDNIYTSNRVIGSKMPTEKIIIHPTIMQPATIVSQKRIMSKDHAYSPRQNLNVMSQSNSLHNMSRQPCIYYQQSHKHIPNVQLINSHSIRSNNLKIQERRPLSPKINLRPQSNNRFNRQQELKLPIAQRSPHKIMNFPQKNPKRQFIKMPGDYVMQNSQAAQRPVFQNFPKSTNQNFEMKHRLRLQSPNQRKLLSSNQYQLMERQNKINFPQHQANTPQNVNMNFHQSNHKADKIYCLSSDQKSYQRPALSVRPDFRRPQQFTSYLSHNQSQNFSSYTQPLSMRTYIRRQKSNKKLEVTLKAK